MKHDDDEHEHSSARTGERILREGSRWINERGLTMPLREVKLAAIVRRLGLSLGAAYRVWARQEDFHQDLAVHVMHNDDQPADGPVASAALECIESGGSFDDILRAGARAQYASTVGENVFATRLALTASIRAHPRLQDASRQRYVDAFDAFAGLYEHVLDHYEREFVEPWTMEMATAALAALSEGFALQHVVFDALSGEDAYAESVVAMAMAATRPRSTG